MILSGMMHSMSLYAVYKNGFLEPHKMNDTCRKMMDRGFTIFALSLIKVSNSINKSSLLPYIFTLTKHIQY